MFFIITSKTLMRFNVAFFEVLNECLYVLFSMGHSHLLTAKTSSDVNDSLIFTWCERATVGKSLQPLVSDYGLN